MFTKITLKSEALVSKLALLKTQNLLCTEQSSLM